MFSLDNNPPLFLIIINFEYICIFYDNSLSYVALKMNQNKKNPQKHRANVTL